MVRAHLLAAVLLLGLAAPLVLATGALDACTGTTTEAPAATAPLSLETETEVNGSGATCYSLYPAPSFPFRGRVTATLFDPTGNFAQSARTCYMTGLDAVPPTAPLLGCEGTSGYSPTLVPGTMRLRCRADPVPGDPLPISPLGVFTCGVTFNN